MIPLYQEGQFLQIIVLILRLNKKNNKFNLKLLIKWQEKEHLP